MLSLRPGTPARMPQMPRTTMSTGTPARPARYRASMQASSMIELTLRRIQAGLPARLFAISRSMRSMRPSRTVRGATSSRRNRARGAYPDSMLNRVVMSWATSRSQVSSPRSSYPRAVLGW